MENTEGQERKKESTPNTPSFREQILHNWEYLFLLIPLIASVAGNLLESQHTGSILAGRISFFPFFVIPVLLCLLVTSVRYRDRHWRSLIIRYAVAGGICPFLILLSAILGSVLGPRHDGGQAIAWFMIMVIPAAGVSSVLTTIAGLMIMLIVRLFSGRLSSGMRILALFTASISVLVIFYGIMLSTCGKPAASNRADYFGNLSFTSDGKAIVFERRNGKSPTQIQMLDLASGELTAYQSPEGEIWVMPKCSPCDGRVVLVIHPPDENHIPGATQIATMNVDGSNFKKLTDSNGYKTYPSLPYSGETLIYAKSEQEGGKRDIYEVDLATQAEKRITTFGFYITLFHRYLPDGKRFSFTGEEMVAGRYGRNRSIYVMQLDNPKLEPLLLRQDSEGRQSSASGPLLVSKDGSMFFCDQHNKHCEGKQEKWQQCFAYSSDGNHRLILEIEAIHILSADISPDGKKLALAYRESRGNRNDRIALYSTDTGQRQDVLIPQNLTHTIRPR